MVELLPVIFFYLDEVRWGDGFLADGALHGYSPVKELSGIHYSTTR